jgi:hypothetical protein
VTRFRRYGGRRDLFSSFALPDSFSAVWREPGPVFMFCAAGLVFGSFEGVGSRYHVLRSGTSLGRYRGRRVTFSRFALPDSFSAISRAYAPVFMFCAPELVFRGTDGVASRFHVLRSETRFRRFRGRRVPFTCFASPYTFLARPMASGPVFMFCAPDSFLAVRRV